MSLNDQLEKARREIEWYNTVVAPAATACEQRFFDVNVQNQLDKDFPVSMSLLGKNPQAYKKSTNDND